MFKQLIIIFSLVSVLATLTLAQEKPETEKKDQKDCSHSCCGTKESHTDVNMEMKSETAEGQIWNKVCPVEGKLVNSDSSTFEFNGKVFGFCCEGCDSKFQKDPETFLKNLNEDGSKFIGKS